MRKVVIVVVILVVILLLGGFIHSLAGQVPFVTAIQDVIGGIVGIVGNLGEAIGRALSSILPKPPGN